MALMDFIKKQFIDILEWTESGDGTLAWRYPMAGNEIQYGGSLTVRESQMAVFVNEGKVADVFGPGMHKLTTQTLPVLTYLKNWDKLFQSPFKSDLYFFSTRQQIDRRWGTTQPVTIRDKDFGAVRLRAFGNYAYRIADPKLFQSPFKSDVYFFSTRQQLDRRWGTTQPVTIRDKDFGAVRLRAFGNYAYRIADPKAFHIAVSGTRDRYTVDDLDGQLRALMLQHISDAVASSGIPFLDLAANQIEFANQLKAANAEEFAKLGLALESVTVQNVSLPEELQKILDQKIGMGMVGGDMGKFMQYQTAQAIPKFAEGGAGGGGSGIAGDAMGLGAGVALGQVMAQQLAGGLAGSNPAAAAAAAAAAAPVALKPDEVMATLEKLAELKQKGILTEDEFSTKKAELLKKLV